MPLIPSRIQDQLDFFDQHAPVWVTNAAAIGLAPLQAGAFQANATAARNSYNAKLAAEEAARIATLNMQTAVRNARLNCADLVRIIRGFAEVAADPNLVYTKAQIPPPAAGTPMPPPGQPTDLGVGIEPTSGDIELRWKVANPAGATGTSYIVRRKLVEQAEWTFVGVTGAKRFVDDTFLAGPDSVQYTVQGQRSDSTGPVSSILTVNFGKQGGSLLISSVSGGGGDSVKLAA